LPKGKGKPTFKWHFLVHPDVTAAIANQPEAVRLEAHRVISALLDRPYARDLGVIEVKDRWPSVYSAPIGDAGEIVYQVVPTGPVVHFIRAVFWPQPGA
jgi:hypothetical protein